MARHLVKYSVKHVYDVISVTILIVMLAHRYISTMIGAQNVLFSDLVAAPL
jgi:hypothetical protein